jgi:hypothetical protein
MTTSRSRADARAEAERWFVARGLPYFVDDVRASVRDALSRPRLVSLGLVASAFAAAAALVTALWSADPSASVLAAIVAAGIPLALYAVRALHAGTVARWAVLRTLSSLGLLFPLVTRALPLLLLFVTFLFINTEVWQVASNLSVGVLWLTVLLFVLLGIAFLLVRLPEEVDRTDDDVDERLLRDACRGTPLEGVCHELLEDPEADPAAYAEVTGFERWNLILVLVIIQSVQVLLLTLAVFGFLVLFGSLIMTEPVMISWLDREIEGVTPQLIQVATFLAAFSGLYLTVSTVTDETYREQFFGSVLREMERAVGLRAVYLAARDRTARPSPAAGSS